MTARRTMSAPGVELRINNRQHWTRDRQTTQRTIIKQGYLKKLPNASRLGASLKKVERRWFIFGIIGQSDPYLEYYQNEESIFGSQPLNIIFLDTCFKISRDQKTSRFTNIFTLVLKERQLSLVAPNRDAMFQWSRAIEDKLCNLGIIESSSHGANDYIRIPSMERQYPAEQRVPPERHYLDVRASGGTFADGEERHYLDVRASGGTFANVEERHYLDVRASGGTFANLEERHYLDVCASGGTFASLEERHYLEVHASGGTFASMPFELEASGQDEKTAQREVCYANVARDQCTTDVTEDTYDLTVSANANDDASIYMTASPATDNLYMNVTKSATDSHVIDSTLEVASSSLLSAQERYGTQSACVQFAASTEQLSSSPPSLSPKTLVHAHSDALGALSTLDAAKPCAEQCTIQSPTTPSAAKPPAPTPPAMLSTAQSSEIRKQNRKSAPFGLPSYDEAMTSPDEMLSRYGDLRFSSRPSSASVKASSRHSASPTDLASSSNELSVSCASGISEFSPPPPYSSRKVLFKGANLPLKQIQVQKLIEEIGASQGIQVNIPKNQCQRSIAFTDCFNKIWVGGWNQHTCPTFHSFLHIGDQLVAINGVAPNSRAAAKKMLKTCSGKTDAMLTIRRIPCGRVLAVRKDNSAVESLGITVVNGTAEIGFVDPTGLARQSGLEEKAQAMSGIGGGGSWWITEINNQPLNLFYKDDETKHRLSAMGNYISFVVQPTQLIVEMKRQLKNMTGFRDFLVQ